MPVDPERRFQCLVVSVEMLQVLAQLIAERSVVCLRGWRVTEPGDMVHIVGQESVAGK